MQAIIKASKISGTIYAPSSKSSMQRACAAALLHNGVSIIERPGTANDDKAALAVINQMGAKYLYEKNILTITSQGYPNNFLPGTIDLNFGESGLAVRMFTPIAALSPATINITGEGSLVKRPMGFFKEILPQLGVEINLKEGRLPMNIKGPMEVKDIQIDGSLSSQFLTGLLFAFANSAKSPVTIFVNSLKSRPYIDLTLAVMKDFGYKIFNDNYERFVIEPKREEASGQTTVTYAVEGDWSGAAFMLVAGAVGGNVAIKGLQLESPQGDKAILQAIEDSGASVTKNNGQVSILAKKILNAFEFDATECPDLFPPLAALAANCDGVSVIKGVSRLANKESDRGLTLQDIFNKMGIEVILDADVMKIKGGKIFPAEVSSHHDHRIAMAAAIAAINSEGIVINNAEAINKSYPSFYDDLMKIGGSVILKN